MHDRKQSPSGVHGFDQFLNCFWRMGNAFHFRHRILSCLTVIALFPMQCLLVNGQEEKQKIKTELQDPDRIRSIETRLGSIEARLTRIESALFASVRFSEAEARKQLAEAKASLKTSETLYAKGLLSAFQMRIDRFNLERAQALHRMCVDHSDHRKIGATMEIFDAKSDLERLKFRLSNSESMFERGFIAKSQLEIDRKDIAVAEKKLAAAQAKLKAMDDSSSDSKDGSNEKLKKEVPKK